MKNFICLMIWGISSIAFANGDPINGLKYFNQYSENKNEFLRLTKLVSTERWSLKNESWAVNADANLTTDVAIFQRTDSSVTETEKTLVVFSSGIHGIEGFVGSAIQRRVIEDKLIVESALKADLAFIHILNPWGMQNKRRVDATNIDLNRNFSDSNHIFAKPNNDYMKIDSFLNPNEKLDFGIFNRADFLYQAIRLIMQFSIETLRKSILLGQNQQPRGLYFSGKTATALKAHIDQFSAKYFPKYNRVIWIDLHTGYGARGRLHLLANESTAVSSSALTQLFDPTPIDFGNQKNFYKTDGDLASYLNAKEIYFEPKHTDTISKQKFKPYTQIIAVVFEYGTLNSQSTWGSIESLRRMVLENQTYQNGATDSKYKSSVNKLFQDMYFPQDAEWAEKVGTETNKVLSTLGLGL